MGRRKINVEFIQEERNRQVTFNKRKAGLFKKAMELSILTGCQMAVIIFSPTNELHELVSNGDSRGIMQKYCKCAHLPHELVSNGDYDAKVKAAAAKKAAGGKKRASSHDSSSDDDDGTLQTMMDMSNGGAATVAAQNQVTVPLSSMLMDSSSSSSGFEKLPAEIIQKVANLQAMQPEVAPAQAPNHFEKAQLAQEEFMKMAMAANNAAAVVSSSSSVTPRKQQLKNLQEPQQPPKKKVKKQQQQKPLENAANNVRTVYIQEPQVQQENSILNLLPPMTPNTAAVIQSIMQQEEIQQKQQEQPMMQRMQQYEQQQLSNPMASTRIQIQQPQAKRAKLPELNVAVPSRSLGIPMMRAGGFVNPMEVTAATPTPSIDSLLISPTSEYHQIMRTPTTPSG